MRGRRALPVESEGEIMCQPLCMYVRMYVCMYMCVRVLERWGVFCVWGSLVLKP